MYGKGTSRDWTYATKLTRSLRTPPPMTSFKLSSCFMEAKLALPTPTTMMDNGCWAASTRASLVASMSLISPSVMINSIVYFCLAWLE